MKKGELKNRLRRRTADKLYDLARTTGNMPPKLPAAGPHRKEHGIARQITRVPAKRQLAIPQACDPQLRRSLS